MINKLIISAFISSTIIGCSPSPAQNGNAVYIFNSELNTDNINKKITLEKKRTAIEFESGFIANDCMEYLSEIKNTELKGTSFNLAIQNEYISCEALDLIKNKVPSTNKNPLSYGSDIASGLDLSSFPSSLNRRSRENNKTLSDFGSQDLTINSFSAIRETADWTYAIEIIASTDLNDDKINDLIIWVHDKAKQGSYNTYTTLVIPLHNNNQPLSATPYKEWNP
ncbi:MAG: hypothetical protein QM484_01480 [Woeseiaceae bacterium]